MPILTTDILIREAQEFSYSESSHKEKSLFGITDGKAVGTYLEHKFKEYLRAKYNFEEGNSASGIDFPVLSSRLDRRFTGWDIHFWFLYMRSKIMQNQKHLP